MVINHIHFEVPPCRQGSATAALCEGEQSPKCRTKSMAAGPSCRGAAVCRCRPRLGSRVMPRVVPPGSSRGARRRGLNQRLCRRDPGDSFKPKKASVRWGGETAFPSFFPSRSIARVVPALPGLCREGPAAERCSVSPHRGGSYGCRCFAVACLGMGGKIGEGCVSPASLPGATGDAACSCRGAVNSRGCAWSWPCRASTGGLPCKCRTRLPPSLPRSVLCVWRGRDSLVLRLFRQLLQAEPSGVQR